MVLRLGIVVLLGLLVFPAPSQQTVCFTNVKDKIPCSGFIGSNEPCVSFDHKPCFCKRDIGNGTEDCGSADLDCVYRLSSGRKTNQRCFKFDTRRKCFLDEETFCDENAGSECQSGLTTGTVFDGPPCSCLRSNKTKCDSGNENCSWFVSIGTKGKDFNDRVLASTGQSCVYTECYMRVSMDVQCPMVFPEYLRCATKVGYGCFCGDPSGFGDKKCPEYKLTCTFMYENKSRLLQTSEKRRCVPKRFDLESVCYSEQKNLTFCGEDASEICWDIRGKSPCKCLCIENKCHWNIVDNHDFRVTNTLCNYDKTWQCFTKSGNYCGIDSADTCFSGAPLGKKKEEVYPCLCKDDTGLACRGVNCSWYIGDRPSRASLTAEQTQPCQFVDHSCSYKSPISGGKCEPDDPPDMCYDAYGKQCTCRVGKDKGFTGTESCPIKYTEGIACFWHNSLNYTSKLPCEPWRQQCFQRYRFNQECDIARNSICRTGPKATIGANCQCLDNKSRQECQSENKSECSWYYQSPDRPLRRTKPAQPCRLVDTLCVEKRPHMSIANWRSYTFEKFRCSKSTNAKAERACLGDETARPCSCRQAANASRPCSSEKDECFWAFEYDVGRVPLLTSSHCKPTPAICLRRDEPGEPCRPADPPEHCPNCTCVQGRWHLRSRVTAQPCHSPRSGVFGKLSGCRVDMVMLCFILCKWFAV